MIRRGQSVDCLLLLGGNIGDRRRHLRRALTGLAALPGTKVLKTSRVYETAPVGPSLRAYLNLAASVRTSLSAMGLLIELKRIEALSGRRPAPRWSARTMDLDILSFGRLRIKTPWLRLPHPEIARRAFALAPLSDLKPDWKPDGKNSVTALLRRLNPGPGIVSISDDVDP